MKRISLLQLLFAIVVFTSCGDEFLDVYPKGEILATRTEDIRKLLDQVDYNGDSYGFALSHGNDFLRNDDVAVLPITFIELSNSETASFTWARDIYRPEYEDPDWKVFFNQIYVANYVIKTLPEMDGPGADKEVMEAEAKVHRAWAYFMLASIYCKPYNKTTAGTDLGLPLRLETRLTGNLSRVPLQQVYDLVIKDLNDALPNLPDQPLAEFTNRPSKSAVYAILARVYLNMADYGKAKNNANEALGLFSTLYDYNELPSHESYDDKVKFPTPLKNEEQYLLKKPNGVPGYNGYTGAVFCVSNELAVLYDSTDLRLLYRYDSDPFFEDESIFTFLEDKFTTYGVVIGPSVPEMLLTRAECYAREGDVDNAMADINTLRETRILAGEDFELTAADAGEALEMVKEERRRELAFKGHRWFDLRRYNAYDDANITLTHYLPVDEESDEYTTHILEPNSPGWVLPIARRYLLMNPEIQQNPQ